MSRAPVAVVGALIIRGGRVLMALRPEDKRRGGLWEFPGGKVEPGETGAQALARELQEELGVTVRVGALTHTVQHAYDDITIRMELYACEALSEPEAREHAALRWLLPHEMDTVPVAPADVPVVKDLQSNGLPTRPR